MQIRERQLIYGTGFGAAAFLGGWLLTWVLTPVEVATDVPRWQAMLWVWLNTHFVPVEGTQVHGPGGLFTQVDLVAEYDEVLRPLRALPVLVTALAGLLAVEAIGYTNRFTHLAQNSGSVLIGYLAAGLLAVVVSDAQPAVASVVVLGTVIFGAAWLGSVITQRVTAGINVFAFVSLGGLVLVGLAIIIGGMVVLDTIGPLLGVAAVGVILAAVLAYIARNAPW